MTVPVILLILRKKALWNFSLPLGQKALTHVYVDIIG
jgi:hypothetical protein